MNEKSHEDTTSADKSSIGFDYQYYYFLNLLLELEPGEKIGYEVHDDVHINLSDERIILIQTKHSLQKNKNKEVVNLTERDIDLWKTLYNWIEIVNDKVMSRAGIEEQLKYIKNAEFILVSNKKESEANKFLVYLNKFKNLEINLSTLKEYIEDLILNTKDAVSGKNKVKLYMEHLIKQDERWLNQFLNHIKFNLDEDDLIQKIRRKIAKKIYEDDETRVDEVLHSVNSIASIWKYENIKKGEKFEVSFEDVRSKFYKCFHNGRSKSLPNRRIIPSGIMPEKLEEQVFIKQLVDIGDVHSSNFEDMADLTRQKISTFETLESWIQHSDMTEDERRDFENECIAKWKIRFRKNHRDPRTPHNERALQCLDELRELNLEVLNHKLSTELSNGQFYLLSDKPYIGWLTDWKERYVK